MDLALRQMAQDPMCTPYVLPAELIYLPPTPKQGTFEPKGKLAHELLKSDGTLLWVDEREVVRQFAAAGVRGTLVRIQHASDILTRNQTLATRRHRSYRHADCRSCDDL